jgi:hypothetical protein
MDFHRLIAQVIIEVVDKDVMSSDDSIGSVSISLASYTVQRADEAKPLWYALTSSNGQPAGRVKAAVAFVPEDHIVLEVVSCSDLQCSAKVRNLRSTFSFTFSISCLLLVCL